jgi:subtilisin family serine protease
MSLPLGLVNLTALMERTSGRRDIVVAVIDGPVNMVNRELWGENVQFLNSRLDAACRRSDSAACVHGTFVAAILAGRRGSPAPAICPGCTLLVRPIFSEFAGGNREIPSSAKGELADAIIETVDAGARVLNLSLSLTAASLGGERLQEAFNYAGRRGAIAVLAAGNQKRVGGPAMTSHSWVVPVVACNASGRPMPASNLSGSAAKRGLSAPGEDITSIDPDGKPLIGSGTSAAAAMVSGTIALLWSEFPAVDAGTIRLALTQTGVRRRRSLVPPLLNAWAAYEYLRGTALQSSAADRSHHGPH